jgi:hypothetical protein
MRSNAFGILALTYAGLFMFGCGDSGSECPEGEVPCDDVCIPEIEPVLTDIQASVFNVSCNSSSCHDAQAPQANLDMSSTTASRQNLINVSSDQVPSKVRVAPGDVDASYLFDKMTDTNIAPGTTPMPQGGFPICESKLLAVEQWIADGAP